MPMHLALTTAYSEWEPVRDAVLKITFAELLRSYSHRLRSDQRF